MDNICNELNRLTDWLSLSPIVPLCFAEAGIPSEPVTPVYAFVELLFMEKGGMLLEVGGRQAELRAGDLALMNAHFGNRGKLLGRECSYACVSFSVENVKELSRYARAPLLLTGRLGSIERVSTAYRKLCGLHHAPPYCLPEIWIKAAALQLFATMQEEAQAGLQRGGTGISAVATALRLLAERQSDPELSLSDLAKAAQCSPSHLGRVFRQEMNTGPMEHLAQLRVRRAQHLLSHTSLEIKEIAFRVGVRDPLYFSRLFRKACNLSPRAYRRQAGRISVSS